MPTAAREKLVIEVNARILAEVRSLARSEERSLQALVDEALAALVEKRGGSRPRAHVAAAYQASHDVFGPLYRKLAE